MTDIVPPQDNPRIAHKYEKATTEAVKLSQPLFPKLSGLSIRQQSAQKLLFQFSKTFVSVMESTVFAKSESDEFEDEEADEYFDDFERFSSYSTLEQMQPISDEEFAFEKYFPLDQKDFFRNLFTSVAFDIFQSYEYQLIMLVREKRKISEIAEDIVHRILDNFKESQRGFNPDYIKPEITHQFLIDKALQHSEPEGIIYNSEWSAVEILENPGIIIKAKPESIVNTENKLSLSLDNAENPDLSVKCNPSSSQGTFYQSHWQKNFIGVKKKIGSKYGFRLKFDFETEISILRNFEKVPFTSVSPLYLQYEYCLDPELLEICRAALEKEFYIEDRMKKFGIVGEEKHVKDKVKEFQIKLQIQKQEEDMNSDKVMKQVVNLSQRFETLKSKLDKLEERGIIKGGEVAKTNAKVGLLRSNYNVRFEVRDQNSDFDFPFETKK